MKPISFNTEMVRAILAGRKTVTRRVAFQQNDLREFRTKKYPEGWWFRGRVYKTWDDVLYDLKNSKYSYRFRNSDILYVQETWAPWSRTYSFMPEIHYKADGEELPGVKWRPSIHMPREAARIFLRVTDVRVERLQEISIEQAAREGFIGKGPEIAPIEVFLEFWNSTTIKSADRTRYSWEANPWVWVIEFERCGRPD